MNDRIINKIDMIGACINVAEKPAHSPAWNTPPVLDFVADFAALKVEYGNISAAIAAADAATTGPADAKDLAETALENIAFSVARSLCVHYKKTGNLTDRAKVNLTKPGLVRLRDQALKTTCELIRDLANAARDETGAAGRGVTQARVLTLTSAIEAFIAVMSAPRGQIATSSTLRRDIETRVAALMERMTDLDDLALQYDQTAAGRAFIAAWFQARNVIDSGHGPTPTPTPSPTPTPTPSPTPSPTPTPTPTPTPPPIP